uniref:myosin regulatory light chain, smooth muscle-like n=1 Tax=Styela clava TaxID=7725 RepID=UPI0019396244|nr:myosin regulatory light chain, smooth muscle-like [Styela clava]XP_039257824.1 myosin regulatory light chain, smooth muscle-like [Styela clava]
MAPKKGGKKGAKKEQKANSNVFSMFDQNQIQEFKEAFSMIDANRDGFIDKIDLKDTYSALGVRDIKMEKLEAMILEAPSAINFTVFLNMLADKLQGTDPEDTLVQAFKILDPENTGVINKDVFTEMFMTQGKRFTKEEIDQVLEIAPVDVAGNLDYKALCYVITHGQEEE